MTDRACYFISGSPPCWSVMLALAVKGLSYDARRLSNSAGEQKSAEFLAINPRGNVPVLVDGDVTVRETNAILAYLDAAYAEPPLFGTDKVQTAEIWQTVCEAGDRLRAPIGNLVRPIFRKRSAEKADEIMTAIELVYQELSALEANLANRHFVCGSDISAADLIVFPAVMQLLRGANYDGADGLDLQVLPLDEHYPNLADWARRIEAIPGYEAAYPPHWR
ncbi:glutathione S-transferase family protein [Ruegeria lacuscaerulensis]|uniref:glutathione S-transferase family protein n=1 Tax=Ruegeria lacuscaerulensis TaxID=55218 RepID=UPI00147DEDA5|nr:glutathione S-transferase family protein [Ruegeria lacuscaerulensis]